MMDLKLLTFGLAGLFAAPSPASAGHHLVERALQEARCLPTSVQELSKAGANTVYEARCMSGAPRTITLVCTPARCLSDDHGSHDEEEELP